MTAQTVVVTIMEIHQRCQEIELDKSLLDYNQYVRFSHNINAVQGHYSFPITHILTNQISSQIPQQACGQPTLVHKHY